MGGGERVRLMRAKVIVEMREIKDRRWTAATAIELSYRSQLSATKYKKYRQESDGEQWKGGGRGQDGRNDGERR